MEIKEALAVAALTRKWSTVLNGAAYDMEKFKADVASYSQQFTAKMKEVTQNNPFWDPGPYLAREPQSPR